MRPNDQLWFSSAAFDKQGQVVGYYKYVITGSFYMS